MNPVSSMNARRTNLTRDGRARAVHGFTMVELMFSILVVGILLGLLIVGARSSIKYVKATGDQRAVSNVAMAIKEFHKQFGFYPPLVKETGGDPASGNGADVNMAANPRRINVYDLGNTTDLDTLEAQGVAFNAADPFTDLRWSSRSLAIYLVGGLNVGFDPTRNNPSAANYVAIDGVTGPGFYAPRQNGTFDVPPEAVMTGGTASKRGIKHEPLLNLGGSALKLFTDPSDPTKISILDRNGVAIRYYRWQPANPTVGDLLDDLRVPVIVGRKSAGFPKTPASRDLEENTALRGARWAVVAAGPNGYFGDEDITILRSNSAAMDLPAGATDAQLRAAAEQDNIVEVGQ